MILSVSGKLSNFFAVALNESVAEPMPLVLSCLSDVLLWRISR